MTVSRFWLILAVLRWCFSGRHFGTPAGTQSPKLGVLEPEPEPRIGGQQLKIESDQQLGFGGFMPTLHLTDRALRSLDVPVRTEYWDEALPGFGVRVSPSGDKSYFVMYWSLGRRRRLTLGKYPELSLADARREAKARMGEVATGKDPAPKVRERGRTFKVSQLAEQFLELYARPRKRSWREDERLLHRDVLPVLGDLPATSIRRAHVRDLLDTIVERGSPIAANRTKAVMSKMFAWGLERDLVEMNPCSGLSRPAPEGKRTRVLSEDELVRLWLALENEDPAVRDAFRLLILTAQRRGEVRQIAEEHIEGDVWTIPAEISKNKRAHAVPLSTQVMLILGPLRGSGCLLRSPRKPGEPLSKDALSQAARRIAEKLGFDFTPHDLRRTASTRMRRLSIDRFAIERVLNHADLTVTGQHYDLYSNLPEKREALQRWADHVEGLIRAGKGTP